MAQRSRIAQMERLNSPSQTNHLGKFAYEDEMPSWLARKLAKDGQICTDGKKPADKRSIMAY